MKTTAIKMCPKISIWENLLGMQIIFHFLKNNKKQVFINLRQNRKAYFRYKKLKHNKINFVFLLI